MTTGIAVAFMLTSVLLVRLAASSSGGMRTTPDAMSGSVLEGAPAPASDSSNQPEAGSTGSKPAEPVPAVPKAAEQAPAAVPAPAAAEKVEGAKAPETKK